MRKLGFAVVLVLSGLVVAAEQPQQIPETVQSDQQARKEITYPATNKDDYTVGEPWKLVWSDEFDGDELNMKNWTRQVLLDPYNDEWEQYGDSTENSYVDNGYLVVKAIHISDVQGDNQYTSARLHTGGKQEWQYGRIAARIQLPCGKGIWPAFWMLGADIDEIGGPTPWPASGEIDILELYGSRDDAVVEANIHYDDDGRKMMGAKSFKLQNGIFADKFHVFELEWDENKMTWYVDNEAYCTADITDENMEEFHKKYYILFNIAIGGRPACCPDETTVFPQVMYVDWVRVYQKQTAQ